MKSNNLAKMIGKRVVQSCITILLVTLLVFALIQMVPGDPVANYLGATATEEQIAYYRHLMVSIVRSSSSISAGSAACSGAPWASPSAISLKSLTSSCPVWEQP